jgi:eukaryotic-like serine/threonine-protein kinase
LIDGKTLREWMNADRHPWREVVRTFAAAGHGLMAAHQAGLVHRDFKPENVMLTRTGQILVSDFGLARPAGELPDTGQPSRDDAAIAQSTFSQGSLVGTPAYMAAEQFAGQPTDGRTDQFSFCVALYEALYGERPFAGRSLPELAANVQKGVVRTERRGNAPPALRRIILRGLEALPANRYPSMGPLLDDLQRLASPNRLRLIIWSVAAAVAIATVVATTLVAKNAPVACADGPARMENIWGPAIKERVRRAFLATK